MGKSLGPTYVCQEGHIVFAAPDQDRCPAVIGISPLERCEATWRLGPVVPLETAERLRAAIEDHRRNVQNLGYRVNERTHEPEWGGEYDRRLWAVLPDEPDYTDEKRQQVLSNWPPKASPTAAAQRSTATEGDGRG